MFHASPDLVTRHAQPTSEIICGFSHEWRVYVPLNIIYEPSEIPPPYEAYGKHAQFVLEKCSKSKCKNCALHCIQESSKEREEKESIFEHYNVLFGIKRNKNLSVQVKKNKLEIEMFESSDESSEEEEEEEKKEEDEEDDEDEEDQEKEGMIGNEESESEDESIEEEEDEEEDDV